MIKTPSFKPQRLEVVDSLRGFALLAIVLIHNLEQYNLLSPPLNIPDWLVIIDKGISDIIFFLFAGKAYATFSLLFGFSFYIQMRNARNRGCDYRARFAWRMFLLFLFSQFHALFYNGDILLLYSIVGLLLIMVCNLKDRTLLIIGFICLLQPVEWLRLIYAFINPAFESYGKYFYHYYLLSSSVVAEGSFLEVIRSNIWHGQLYSNLWQVENGRFFQTFALFIFGLLLARLKWFEKSDSSLKNWKTVLFISAIAFLPLFLLKTYILDFVDNKAAILPIRIIFPSLANFTFMCVLVSSFTLLWFRKDGYKLQKGIIPYGRMSLTNYISQSIIGVIIYYGFGLGLYKYTGATYCLFIGFGIFAVQLLFSRWWLSIYKQGPLEYLWRKGTWIGK